jgi:hypothetical protein
VSKCLPVISLETKIEGEKYGMKNQSISFRTLSLVMLAFLFLTGCGDSPKGISSPSDVIKMFNTAKQYRTPEIPRGLTGVDSAIAEYNKIKEMFSNGGFDYMASVKSLTPILVSYSKLNMAALDEEDWYILALSLTMIEWTQGIKKDDWSKVLSPTELKTFEEFYEAGQLI